MIVHEINEGSVDTQEALPQAGVDNSSEQSDDAAVNSVDDMPQDTDSNEDGISDDELANIISSVLESIEEDEYKNKNKEVFGPNIGGKNEDGQDETIVSNTSELDSLKKELDSLKLQTESFNQEKSQLLDKLSELETSVDIHKKEAESYKSDIDMLEDFYQKLESVPVLGDLIKLAVDKGPDKIDIPKYLKEYVDSRMRAVTAENTNRQALNMEEEKPKTSGLEAAIRRRARI